MWLQNKCGHTYERYKYARTAIKRELRVAKREVDKKRGKRLGENFR